MRLKNKNQIDMLHGALLGKIFLFALPFAASDILQQLFNSADVAVVGRFASSRALAAVGSNTPVINLLLSLFIGLSVGTTVVIANYIGRQEKTEIQGAVHSTIVIALISGLILLAGGYVYAPQILKLVDTPDDIMDLATVYLRIYFLGMPFIMLYNFGAAILRSKGDSKRPLYCLIVSGFINVILNLIFVIVFKLSVSGVAMATVVSNIISSGLIVYLLFHEEAPYRLCIKQLRLKKVYLWKILKIGLPAGIQGMVFSISNVCIQSAINGFGSAAIAGSAAALNFEFFVYFVVNAFSQATVTFTSQNFGAGNFSRCKKIFSYTLHSSIVLATLMAASFLFARNQLLMMYTTDTAVIAFALSRMQHVLILEFVPSTYEISGAALRGMGYSMLPSMIAIVGSCLFRLLWVYTIFTKWSTFNMLMTVYPISWAVTGISMILAYYIVRHRLFHAQKAVL